MQKESPHNYKYSFPNTVIHWNSGTWIKINYSKIIFFSIFTSLYVYPYNTLCVHMYIIILSMNRVLVTSSLHGIKELVTICLLCSLRFRIFWLLNEKTALSHIKQPQIFPAATMKLSRFCTFRAISPRFTQVRCWNIMAIVVTSLAQCHWKLISVEIMRY